jgi:hypothetical protein
MSHFGVAGIGLGVVLGVAGLFMSMHRHTRSAVAALK